MSEEAIDYMGRMKEIIRSKSHPIGIVGLGYVGLPLAMAFANKGYKVIGVDTNLRRVEDINAGVSPITDVKNVSLRRMVSKDFIKATSYHAELKKAFVIIMCVPTPLNKQKQPDLSYIEASSAEVGRCMYDGSLVILESTSYPGTTREVVDNILRDTGKDKKYFLAYSPERVDPSSRSFTLRNTPKLVAGIDEESAELAIQLYSNIVKKVVPVSRPEIAETAKVFENVFRNVNIGLVNELAMMCEKLGISVWEVLDGAETKPFGFMRFNPSPGVGGHCFTPETLVMTEYGPERIDTIKVGTRVLSKDGKLHNVLRVYKRWYSGDMVTLKARGLLPVTMTPDHNLYVAKDGRPPKNGRKHHPISGVSTVQVLSDIYKIRAGNASISNYTIWPHINYDNVIAPEYATTEYVLLAGWYLSQGNLDISYKQNGGIRSARIQIALNANNIDDVDSVKKLLPSVVNQVKITGGGYPVHESSVRVQDRGTCIVLRQGCTQLATMIQNDFGKYALFKRLPPWILWGKLDYARDILVGMFHGDGNSAKSVGALSYSTISPHLAFGAKILLDRLGIPATMKTQQHKNRKYIAYSINVSNGPHAVKLSKLLDFPLKCNPGSGRDMLLDREDGFIYHRVQSTKQNKYTGYVYNLWVDDTNNYVAPIGVVANCLPVDPYYLDLKANEVGFHSRFIRDALDINEGMPEYVVQGVAKVLNDNLGKSLSSANILVLGIAYKPDVGDIRESPSVEVLKLLLNAGAHVTYHDPYVNELIDPSLAYVRGDRELIDAVSRSDCVVMITNHSKYNYIKEKIIERANLFYDTRGWTRGLPDEGKIVRLGE